MRWPDLEIGPTRRAIRNAPAPFVALIFEIACGLAVVVNVLLLGNWLRHGTDDDLGMAIDHTVIVTAWAGGPLPGDQSARDLAALAALPEVELASHVAEHTISRWRLPDQARAGGRTGLVWVVRGGERVAAALGVRVAAGHDLTAADIATAQTHPRALISAALAHELFGDADPIGRMVETTHLPRVEIVGVLTRFAALPVLAPRAGQTLILAWPPAATPAAFAVRVRGGAAAVPAVRRALETAAPGRVVQAMLLRDERDWFTRTARGGAWVFAFIIVAVLEIALVGSLAMSSFLVAERTRQIGIRRALGARKRDIVRYFLVENWLVTTAGLLLGVALTVLINWWVRRIAPDIVLEWRYLLYGACAFWVTGLSAALVPALRAASTSPTVASRTV